VLSILTRYLTTKPSYGKEKFKKRYSKNEKASKENIHSRTQRVG